MQRESREGTIEARNCKVGVEGVVGRGWSVGVEGGGWGRGVGVEGGGWGRGVGVEGGGRVLVHVGVQDSGCIGKVLSDYSILSFS